VVSRDQRLFKRRHGVAKIDPVPAHLHTVTPRLIVRNGAEAVDFYVAAFNAHEIGERVIGPKGEVIHAEVRIGDSVVMITEDPDLTETEDGVTAIMATYWRDVDDVWGRAVSAGAHVIFPLADLFYGERGGRLRDPFGQQWMLSQRI
jgi:PhnB protein